MEDFKCQIIHNQIINNAKLLIDRTIYNFLFILFYYLFINIDESFRKKKLVKLKNTIEKINKNIKKQEEKINEKYDNKNLINIIKFVKTQNCVYASEIIENILIIIFSFAFKTKKENTFGKYIYNDIGKFKKNYGDIYKWFIKNKLNNKISNIKNLLENDLLERDQFTNKIQEEPLFDLLNRAYLEKIERKKNIHKRKTLNFVNRRIFDFINKNIQKTNLKNKKNEKGGSTKIDDVCCSITAYSMVSNMFFEDKICKRIKVPIPLIRSLLISVYIFYQNKNSTLMKYREESDDENNLQNIPFEYDISEATIENKFAGIVLSPLRIEPRIDGMKLSKNILKENGFIELAKVLLFNKNIKKIDFHTCMLKSSYIDFLNNTLGLFDNNSVEVLNLSYNYLKEDCAEYLANILSHFKKLKEINLSSNDFKNGISSFLIALKRLYRQGKLNLEILNLSKCTLDDISYYELGEILKSKFCKLKVLCLSDNNIPANTNFLKKLKKNKTLSQIYMNKNNIGNNNTDDIMRIISNSNIEYLYLQKNKISDFSQCLRIINRGKLIKKEGKIISSTSLLYNLDIGHNICFNKNKDKIELFKKSIDETTLYCLDASQILYDNSPDKFLKNVINNEYTTSVNNLVNKLDEEQNKYNKISGKINTNINYLKKLQNINYNEFKELDDEIKIILKENKAIYTLFLKEKAKKLILNNDKIKNEIKRKANNDEKKIKKIYDEIHKKLLDYMILKRENIKIDELNYIINSEKKIII